MPTEPTEREYLLKDRDCALEEIADLEKMLATLYTDVRIIDRKLASKRYMALFGE